MRNLPTYRGHADRCRAPRRAATDRSGRGGEPVPPTRGLRCHLLRLRRHAARPDGEVRRRRAPCRPTPGSDEAGRHGQERPATGLPAQHRRRLVHAGDRHLARRARLDEQHLPPDRRGQLQQPHDASRRPASCRPTHSPRPPSAPARRSSRSSGSAAANLVPALQGPVVDFRTFYSTAAASSSTTTCPDSRPARTPSASVPARQTWPTRPAGRTSRPPSARRSRRPSRRLHQLHRSPDHRQRRSTTSTSTTPPNDGTTNYDRVLIVPAPTRKNGARPSRTWRRASGPTSS